jgi:hypothetical protein
MMRFTLRELILLVLAAGCFIGWVTDHYRLKNQNDSLKAVVESIPGQLKKTHEGVWSEVNASYDKWEAHIKVGPLPEKTDPYLHDEMFP